MSIIIDTFQKCIINSFVNVGFCLESIRQNEVSIVCDLSKSGLIDWAGINDCCYAFQELQPYLSITSRMLDNKHYVCRFTPGIMDAGLPNTTLITYVACFVLAAFVGYHLLHRARVV